MWPTRELAERPPHAESNSTPCASRYASPTNIRNAHVPRTCSNILLRTLVRVARDDAMFRDGGPQEEGAGVFSGSHD